MTLKEEDEYLEAIDNMFWEECQKLGKWKPSENSSHENAFYSWFGDKFFRYRNQALACFSKYPFRCLRITFGEFLVYLITIFGTLAGNSYAIYITYIEPSSTLTGLMSMISMILVFAFSGKISFWNLFFGLSFENQLQFHKAAALNLIISVVSHVVMKGFVGMQGISGIVFIVVLLLIFGFSLNIMRRYVFKFSI